MPCHFVLIMELLLLKISEAKILGNYFNQVLPYLQQKATVGFLEIFLSNPEAQSQILILLFHPRESNIGHHSYISYAFLFFFSPFFLLMNKLLLASTSLPSLTAMISNKITPLTYKHSCKFRCKPI